MSNQRVYNYSFASIYPLYVAKVEKKGRSSAELDAVIAWLTGYDAAAMAAQIERRTTLEAFFAEAPALNPARARVTGVVCGVRIETIEEPLMREIRILDKLVDELARGRPLAKVLRAG